MIAIVDYGVGNLFSLKSSLSFLGIEAVVTRDEETLKHADKIILPGVGAFEDAIKSLRDLGLDTLLIQLAHEGKPILGICLGMQLLFDKSYEYGEHTGLGLIPGNVRPIRPEIPEELKIPHIGWNSLAFSTERSPIFKYLKEKDFVYFVHSYYCADCEPYVTATTEYGTTLTASAQNKNVFGCQFHPEKSGEVGLSILKAFAELECDAQ